MIKHVSVSALATLATLGIITLSGCSTIVTTKADLTSAPNGVRVYAPKIYFLVDESKNKTQIVLLPDYARAYDVKPLTVFAKQDFKIELDEGQLKALTSNQDTTAILSFVKDAATLAAKATGAAMSAQTFDGTFGLKTGIYVLQDDGKLKPQ